MYRKIQTYLTILLLAVNFISCTNDTDDEGELPMNSRMQFIISAPMRPNTRVAIADGDGVNLPTEKTDQTKDGWAIRSLAVFITNENGQPVAGRELVIKENAPNAGKVIFDLTRTDKAECTDIADDKNILNNTDFTIRGKNLLPPKAGPYKIYAIANYKGNNDISTKINNVINKMSSTTDAALPANNKAWTALINSTVSSDASTRLCDKNTDMILSATEDIRITVGNKDPYRIQLKRTRARVRITVRNESLRHAVQINSLSFENFTRSSSSLFPSALVGANATINPQGSNAIIPFNPADADIPKLDDTNPTASERTIFDGYILESEGPYYSKFSSKLFRFSIGVTARTARDAYTKYVQGNAVGSANNGAWYMLQLKQTGEVVIPKPDGSVKLVPRPNDLTLNSPSVNPLQYFWMWDETDFWYSTGMLYSLYEDKYVQTARNNQYMTLGDKVSADEDLCMKNNAIYSYKSGSNYLNLYSDFKWVKQSSAPTNGGWNYIYIATENVPAKGDDKISKTLNLSKLQNNQSFNVFEIKRNDFYHIFINIRYNDNLGHFYFEVLPWTDKNLDIGFE